MSPSLVPIRWRYHATSVDGVLSRMRHLHQAVMHTIRYPSLVVLNGAKLAKALGAVENYSWGRQATPPFWNTNEPRVNASGMCAACAKLLTAVHQCLVAVC